MQTFPPKSFALSTLIAICWLISVNASVHSEPAFRCREVPFSMSDLDHDKVLWNNTECIACEDTILNARDFSSLGRNETRVVMLMDSLNFVVDTETFESFLSLGAGFLLSGSSVVLHYNTPTRGPSKHLQSMHPSLSSVEKMIFGRIPCPLRLGAGSRFQLLESHVDAAVDPGACTTVFCKLAWHQEQYNSIHPGILQPPEDATTTLIVASLWNPVASGLAEYYNALHLVLTKETANLPPLMDAGVWSTWWSLPRHTQVYQAVNRWRHATLRLDRLRHLSELWANALFVTPRFLSHDSVSPTMDHWHWEVEHGLLPPCVPCSLDPIASRSASLDGIRNFTVLVVDDITMKPLESRRMWQEIILAQSSRKEHCEATEETTSRPCLLLNAIRVLDRESKEEDSIWLLPSSIQTEKTYLLDSFARHAPVAIVGPTCEREPKSWTRLPIPYLCPDSKNLQHGDLALRLLKVVYSNEMSQKDGLFQDDLLLLVRQIQKMVASHTKPVAQTRLPASLKRQSNFFPVLCAWLVAITILCASVPGFRVYRGTFPFEPRLALFTEIWTRLSEMDDLLDESLVWLRAHFGAKLV